MTPNSAPRSTSSRTNWLRLYAAVAALPLALTACGGGGGGSSADPQTPTPSPTPSPSAGLSVSASATTTSPSGSSVTLTATVVNSTSTPTWTLTGAGSLSATSGTTITYIPPDSGTYNSSATVTISASIADASAQTVQITLTPVTVGTLQSVDYLNSRYVAVSDSGQALTSADGSAWTTATVLSSGTSTDKLNAQTISHFGSTFIAAGSLSPSPYTTSTGALATSTDGVTWTMSSVPAIAGPVHALVVGPQVLALSDGTVYGSSNLTTWATNLSLPTITSFNAGIYANGRYWLAGTGGWIATSVDGSTNWAASKIATSNGSGVDLHGIAWNGTQYVAVGDNGMIVTSTNGFTWTGATSALTGTLRAVTASSAGEFVIVGDNGVETSTDAVTFTLSPVTSTSALYGVNWLNGQFVAVGANSTIKTFAN
jgi:hypothetical protein